MKTVLSALLVVFATQMSFAKIHFCRQNETSITIDTEKMTFFATQKCWYPCYFSYGTLRVNNDTAVTADYIVHLDSGHAIEPINQIEMSIEIVDENRIMMSGYPKNFYDLENGRFIDFMTCSVREEEK